MAGSTNKPTPAAETDPKPTPPPSEPTDKTPAGEAQANPDRDKTAAVLDVAAEKRERADALQRAKDKLLAELAEVEATAEREGLGTQAKPTHLLVLANGDRVEHSGAIPTHYGVKGGPAVLVVAAHSLEGLI